MTRLLACWGLLLLLLGFTTPDVDPIDEVAFAYGGVFPQLEGTTIWMKCGEMNAYYDPVTRTVILCEELRTLPIGVQRMIYAHELAHAVIDQLEIPYTGLSELAADELSAWMFIHRGWGADVLEIGNFFRKMGGLEDPFDLHPSNLRRAVTFLCLETQSRGYGFPGCPTSWPHVDQAWRKLLGLPTVQ